MENSELTTKSAKPTKRENPDRIVLDKESVELLAQISAQVEDAFGGVIKLTQKELANFVLQNRAQPLTQAELKGIKDQYFDDVRAAQWALQKLKMAKEEGRDLSLSEVMAMIQTPVVSEKRPRKVDAEKRKKKEKHPDQTDMIDANHEPTSAQ